MAASFFVSRLTVAISTGACLLLSSCMQPATATGKGSQPQPLVEPINEFGLTMYKYLRQTSSGKNILISPLSLHSCLYLAFTGAAGKTAVEMAKALQLKAAKQQSYQEFLDNLLSERVNLANVGEAKGNIESTDSIHEVGSKGTEPSTKRATETGKPQTNQSPMVHGTSKDAEARAEQEAAVDAHAPLAQQPLEKMSDAIGVAGDAEEKQAKPNRKDTEQGDVSADNREQPVDTARLSKSSPIELAVSLWANSNVKLLPSFVSFAKEHMNAEVKNLDFASPECVTTINGWVTEKTHNKITKIVTNVSSRDSVVLATAAYLKLKWQQPFSKNATRLGSFRSPTAIKQVPMMQIKGPFQYFEDNTVQILDLPYDDQQSSMLVFLPKNYKNRDGLSSFTRTLSHAQWEKWKTQLESRPGSVQMPRFTLTNQFVANAALSSMGMKAPFSNQANFSKMMSAPSSVPLSKVLHKTFVKVDEEGTEAAAVTATESRAFTAPKPFKMVIDRPFFFTVVNWKTGAILFIGQVNTPA